MTALLPPSGVEFTDALHGDPDALDALLRRHRPAVEAVCFARLQSRTDAEDAVQETMLRGMRALGNVDDPSRLRSYLCRIAERVCLDMLRAGAKAMPMVIEDGPDEADGPEEAALERERARLVHQTLQALSERQATALWMRDALGEPVPVVAQHLGVTEGSARVLLTRARARMRDGWAKVAALIPGAGIKLPTFAAKVLHLGPLGVPATVPAVALMAAVIASPMAYQAIAAPDTIAVRPVAQEGFAKSPRPITTTTPVVVQSAQTTTGAAAATSTPPVATGTTARTAPEAPRQPPADVAPEAEVRLGASTVSVGEGESTRQDDDVTVGDSEVLQVGAEVEEVMQMLDDGSGEQALDISAN